MTHLSRLVYDADEIILRPLSYLSQQGPERTNILARIWRGFNFYYDCPRYRRQKMANILDDTLTASYLMDDIVDDAILRRGLPAAHLVFGVAHTVYSTLYSAFHIFEDYLGFHEYKEMLTNSYITLSLQGFECEIMSTYFRNNLVCPTFEEYSKYFCFSYWIPFSIQVLELYGQQNSKSIISNSVLVDKIATFVTIYNDYLNVQSKKYSKLKGFCDDITEGKFTYLVIHAVRSHPEDTRILELLKKRPTDIESKMRYIGILKEFGTIEFAQNSLKKLRNEILEELERHYSIRNPYLEKAFNDIVENLDPDGELFYEVSSSPIK